MKLSRKELRQLIAESINESMSYTPYEGPSRMPTRDLTHMLHEIRHFLQAVRMKHGISPQEISAIIGLIEEIDMDDINWVRSPLVNRVLMVLRKMQSSHIFRDRFPGLPRIMSDLEHAKKLMAQGY